jgi:hypothetical protein
MGELMSETKVVNLKTHRFDVYIGRYAGRVTKTGRGMFGNPHGMTSCTRDECIEMYRSYFTDKIKNDPKFKAAIKGLRGKVLGCYCKPLACHGDVIVQYLEREPK